MARYLNTYTRQFKKITQTVSLSIFIIINFTAKGQTVSKKDASTYLGIITLKNSYGRSLHQELAITVTNRGQAEATDSIDDNGYDMLPRPTCPDLSVLDTTLQAYPNPSNGVFELFLAADTIVSVNVYNIMGQHVYTDDNIMIPTYTLDLSIFPAGEYIAIVRGKKKEYSNRIIKQKM